MNTTIKTDRASQSIQRIQRFDQHGKQIADAVAVEEPLEIRLRHWQDGKPSERSISITMRTPGSKNHGIENHDIENQRGKNPEVAAHSSDKDLALGFLFTEGVIRDIKDVETIEPCGPALPSGLHNIIKVTLNPQIAVDIGRMTRNFYTTSSCGVCGKASLDALLTEAHYPTPAAKPQFKTQHLQAAPKKLRATQTLFEQTGGIHAAALMNTKGELIAVTEDVGRHNALDKLIGHALQNRLLPLRDLAIILSGRASFELMQKSLMAGCTLVAAVGAPSSLAIDCAVEYDITLVGFLATQPFNIYHRPLRIIS